MRLHDTQAAPSPQRVRIAAAEKGIPLTLVAVDLAALETRSDSFTALNPWQRVPVLELDDGRCLAESSAIVRFFEEIQPEPPLLGRDAWSRALVEQWVRRLDQGLYYATTQVFRHLHPAMATREVPQVAAWGEANRDRVMVELGRLEAQLQAQAAAGHHFVTGGDYTFADIVAFTTVGFLPRAKIVLPESLTAIRAWYDRCAERPSATA